MYGFCCAFSVSGSYSYLAVIHVGVSLRVLDSLQVPYAFLGVTSLGAYVTCGG